MLSIKTLQGKPIHEAYGRIVGDKVNNVDKGIRPLVRIINDIDGLETHSSCSGHRGPWEKIWTGYSVMNKNDTSYLHDRTWIMKEGITLAASSDNERNGSKGEPMVGVVICGERNTILNYIDFILLGLYANRYGRDVLGASYLGLQEGKTFVDLSTVPEKVRDKKIGFFEMMAQWVVVSHLSEKYAGGETTLPSEEEMKHIDEKQNFKPIEEIMDIFKVYNTFNTEGRRDFTRKINI